MFSECFSKNNTVIRAWCHCFYSGWWLPCCVSVWWFIACVGVWCGAWMSCLLSYCHDYVISSVVTGWQFHLFFLLCAFVWHVFCFFFTLHCNFSLQLIFFLHWSQNCLIYVGNENVFTHFQLAKNYKKVLWHHWIVWSTL